MNQQVNQGAASMADTVIEAQNLAKTFRTGLRRKHVKAVADITFSVNRGEIFGFIGPNGAGKTTTLKMLMGLVAPSQGAAKVLGEPVPSIAAKKRVGYLPESPYFYEYLTPEEFLDFVGSLFGLDRATCRKRRDHWIDRLNLNHARGRALRKFSKGMLQRVGIAQALMGDPELVILDEPMTGLDPMGRREVRDLIVELGKDGKTVFFSTHILPDVEQTCDRVAIVAGGRLQACGPLGDLMDTHASEKGAHEVAVVPPADADMPDLPQGSDAHAASDGLRLTIPGHADLNAVVQTLIQSGAKLLSIAPQKPSLEELFISASRKGAQKTNDKPEEKTTTGVAA